MFKYYNNIDIFVFAIIKNTECKNFISGEIFK